MHLIPSEPVVERAMGLKSFNAADVIKLAVLLEAISK
jgi:hypothetical protein